ncbi:YciN family protein [Serratia sp. NPDC078593]|uniref:YciN family protein n=1 Tax=unclassified Serratia (in: enterobacteria) TaxID=2647522 RepID=UPI0037D005C0
MRSNTSPITRQALLEEANNIIRQHDDYLHGMIATDVEQKSGVLVFRGEFFLDAEGLPTAKTTAVFNMFKHLAHVLSEKYHLVD